MTTAQRSGGKGALTRQTIVRAAVDLASVEGLEGLTVGRLASALGMSKSGLFAHFGSKEELQLATVEMAMDIVQGRLEEAVGDRRGLAALQALVNGWLGYIEERFFPGGCFFSETASEVDARPGAVRDRIAGFLKLRHDTLLHFAREAQTDGNLPEGLDLEQLVFEIEALGSAANSSLILFNDMLAPDRARRAIAARLGGR